MSILLDTGVLYAFLNRRDRQHEPARDILQACLEGEHGVVYTTTFTVDEAFTLMLARNHPREKAEDLANLLWPQAHPSPIRMLDVRSNLVQRAHEIFLTHYDRRLSFTDCTHLAAMETHRIGKLASFDHGFDGLVARIAA